jgi:beta-mannosidase
MIWLEFKVGGKIVSRNFVTFVRPKHLELSDPRIMRKVTAAGAGRFTVTLTARRPALWAWLELSDTDATFSDNWICLQPGKPVTVEVRSVHSLKLQAFIRQLKIRSLYDTYEK